MFLKKLKLTNYRKFGENKNVVEFVSSEIIKKEDLAIDKVEENGTIEESIQIEEQSPDVVNLIDTYYNKGKEKRVSLWKKPLRNCKSKMISCLVLS